MNFNTCIYFLENSEYNYNIFFKYLSYFSIKFGLFSILRVWPFNFFDPGNPVFQSAFQFEKFDWIRERDAVFATNFHQEVPTDKFLMENQTI